MKVPVPRAALLTQRTQITELLLRLQDGDAAAYSQLVPLVYEDLRRIARRHLQGNDRGYTLNTTALVHEAYLKMVDRSRIEWRDRDHFLRVYSTVMRNLMVDLARKRTAAKRGGGAKRITLGTAEIRVEEQAEIILALDEALENLREFNPRLSEVVECRFFAGLTQEETASALGVTERTVQRDWTKAKAYLSRWIEED